jgi:hypothetical protein
MHSALVRGNLREEHNPVVVPRRKKGGSNPPQSAYILMNELPKDSEKEIWLHHNDCDQPLYDFGYSFVNTDEEDEIKINRGKIHLDTYKAAMLGCEFEGEYVKNIETGDILEPSLVGDKYQIKAYQNTLAVEKEMAENRA